jgi:protein-disulfide isomerase
LLSIRHMSLPAAEQALLGLGHDLAQLRQVDASVAPLVQRDVDRGQADGVHSTPSFFFNGAPWDGHYDLATLRQRLEAAPVREG